MKEIKLNESPQTDYSETASKSGINQRNKFNDKTSLNRQNTYLALILALGVTMLPACKEKNENGVVNNQEVPRNTSVPLSQPDWFYISQEVNIPRAEIPDKLPGLLNGVGVVSFSPDNYDISRPNVYIIGNRHTSGVVEGPDGDPYQIQEDGVKITHVLYSLGIRRQLIEGFPNGMELTHDIQRGLTDEVPEVAIGQYLQSGKVKRNTTAIEAIYKGRIESMGVDDPYKAVELTQKMTVNEQGWVTFSMQAVAGMAQELEIPLDFQRYSEGQSATNPFGTYHYEVANRVQAELSQLAVEERLDFIERHLFSHPQYKLYFDSMVEYYYFIQNGRSEIFAERINQMSTGENPVDMSFTVGADHIERMIELISEANVFVIFPESEPYKTYQRPFSRYSLEDYRRILLEQDLYDIGLGEESEARLFLRRLQR